MNEPLPQNSGVSHLSAIVLALITILCVVLIGVTGAVKYQLDRSEVALAAPDVSFTPHDDMYDSAMRALGYGGFLGAAYRMITKHDTTAIDDMKLHLKTARGIIGRLDEKAPTSVRHDLQSILDLYSTIYEKAEDSITNTTITFTQADLAPALAALPALDTRLQAAIATSRLKAQDSYRFWGLSLTLIAWISLLLAASMAAGIYLVYRNRQAAPLRALAQSIRNLARGDMQNPIWGMNRNDAIGELARAVDLARYHFSQLPDVSLMSDQGPVRLKFEGETRSIFEAMMRNMTDEFEHARRESSGYAHNLSDLQETLSTLAAHMNTVITQLQVHDTDSHQALQQLVYRINETSQTFTQTQERTIVQMNKLLPYMQERASKMAEVTSIAGSQVAQSLQTLMKTEEDLRQYAVQSQQTVEQISSKTNELGERLFASSNLMQASSKMLSETTDTVQSRFNEAVEALGRGETHLNEIMENVKQRLDQTARSEENMAALAKRAEDNLVRMEGAVHNMTERHEQLSEQVVLATHRMESIVSSFEGAQRSLTEAMQHVKHDGELLSGLLTELRNNNDHLLKGIMENSKDGRSTVQGLADQSHKLLTELEKQIAEQSRITEMRIGELATNTQDLSRQVLEATSSLSQTVTDMRDEHERFSKARANFSDNVNQLSARLDEQTTTTITKAEKWATENYTKLSALTGNMEELMSRVSILGQLTGTLGNVAGQLGQIVPALANGGGKTEPSAVNADLTHVVDELNTQLKGQWNAAMAHMEAMHDQLAHIIEEQKDKLETRLVVMDKKLRAAPDQGALDPKQVDLMNEIVVALAKISEHVMMLDEAVQGRTNRRQA